MIKAIKNKINNIPSVKKIAHFLLMPLNQARPRLWVKLFVNPFFHSKKKGSLIRRRTRMDVFPFNQFILGSGSTIEDFSTVNNAAGSVTVGNNSRIGLGNVIIGPVTIGNETILAQNVVISGLNHNYTDVNTPVRKQGISTLHTEICDGAWIGANSIITSGVRVGKNCVIAAGSVVTKNIPDFAVAAGNPARVLKKYDKISGLWVKAA